MAVIESSLERESQDRYLTYALSVVSSRALPDVRDGLKPVQRRILYAMYKNLNLKPNSSYRKSASVVGEVLGNYHPHSDTACYEAMVRMAQDFSLRYPIVDGQGNFGSIDGDSAAAYRYTEARLRPFALEVIGEIDEETVEFRDNFDGRLKEPQVFPSRVPNLLVNGVSGIAVGMATSVPPHNLKNVVSALIGLLEDKEITNSKLVSLIKAPDFPTGCTILNSKNELEEIYATGKGAIRMRGEWEEEEGQRGKKFVIITSVPYGVNKSQLIEKIAQLITDKKLPQIVDIRDESTDEVRVVLELAPNADSEVAMAFIYKNTALESNFNVNLTALVPTKGISLKPQVLSLKECLNYFLEFRVDVTKKRLIFEKKQLEARVHILEALAKIFDSLDEAIKIVRKSDGRQDAALKLAKRFDLTEVQSFAVVDMKIYQLSRTNIEEVRAELKAKLKRIKEIDNILKNEKAILNLVKEDLELVAKEYGDARKSKLIKDYQDKIIEFDKSEYVVKEDVYAIVTKDGWIKRIRQNNELSSTRLRDGDSIFKAFAISTLDNVVFITNLGNVYSLNVSEFPSSSGYGVPIQKILKFKDGEIIVESFFLKLSEDEQIEVFDFAKNTQDDEIRNEDDVILITKNGLGTAYHLDDLSNIKKSGRRIMKIKDGDELRCVVKGNKVNLAMFTSDSSALSIKTKEIPLKDSPVVGITLMGIRDDDELVAAISYDKEESLVIKNDKDKEVLISASDIVKGKRALKGNKVLSKAKLISVTLAR